jgi:hypothetical protein
MNRSERRIPKALMAAFAVSGLVIWQIGVGSRGGGLLGGVNEQGKDDAIAAPGLGAKFHGRDRPEIDPVTAYVEKAKRGMTEREIRRIISDFEAIGFMPSSGNLDALREFREKQNDWYLTALGEALSLTSAQKREVWASLKESLDRTMEVYAGLGTAEAIPGIYCEMYFEASLWMRTDEFAPWNLCELTEAQSQLTLETEWRNHVERVRNNPAPFSSYLTWFARLSVSMEGPVLGSLIGYEPGSTMNTPSAMPGIGPGGIIDASTPFPLTPDQKLEYHPNDVVAQVKILHPAQLRLGLLLNPSLAGSILQRMDNPAPGG